MKNERTTRLETRLAKADREKFVKLAQEKGVTTTELLRAAALFYLEHHHSSVDELKDNKIERRLRAIETRYAGLLVRIGLDVATLSAVVSNRIEPAKRKETLEMAYQVAIKHFNKKLEGVAKELKENLSTMGSEHGKHS